MAGDVHIMNLTSKFLFVFLCCSFSVGFGQKSLYTDEDPVIQLTDKTFKQTITGAENGWFVEFYSSWCGHCIRFAPTWRQLAREVHEWGPVMKIAAIDCAKDQHMPVCREYNIEGFPTLKLFPANALANDNGTEYKEGREVWKLKEAMMDAIEHQSAANRPQSWPKFHVLQTLEDIWQDIPPGIKYHIVIFEEAGSYLGRQVILDMLQNENVLIRRMLKDSISQFGIRDFPSAYLIDQEGTFQKLAYNKESDVKLFENDLKKKLGEKGQEIRLLEEEVPRLNPAQKHANQAAQQEQQETSVIFYPDGVHSQDLESGLTFALRHEIAGRKLIEGKDLYALKAFVLVLSKHFPGSDPVIRYLKKLNGWLQDQDRPITGEEWLRSINSLQTVTAYLPPREVYTGCRGSTPELRGYPCSLWTIFHSLTVNAARDRMEDFEPREVLLAMKGYIGRFFGCVECRGNFLKMAESLNRDVRTGDDAILWLWRGHNRANLRLHGDPSEDPQHPKLQFPASAMCPDCWTASNNSLKPVEQNILKFLKDYYSRDNIKQDSEPFNFKAEHQKEDPSNSQLDLQFHPKDIRIKKKTESFINGEKDSVEAGNRAEDNQEKIERLRMQEVETRFIHSKASAPWGITNVDISICLLFYFLCTCIIIGGYFHLSINKRIKIWGFCKCRGV